MLKFKVDDKVGFWKNTPQREYNKLTRSAGRVYFSVTNESTQECELFESDSELSKAITGFKTVYSMDEKVFNNFKDSKVNIITIKTSTPLPKLNSVKPKHSYGTAEVGEAEETKKTATSWSHGVASLFSKNDEKETQHLNTPGNKVC